MYLDCVDDSISRQAQCLMNVGTMSTSLAQHSTNVGHNHNQDKQLVSQPFNADQSKTNEKEENVQNV